MTFYLVVILSVAVAAFASTCTTSSLTQISSPTTLSLPEFLSSSSSSVPSSDSLNPSETTSLTWTTSTTLLSLTLSMTSTTPLSQTICGDHVALPTQNIYTWLAPYSIFDCGNKCYNDTDCKAIGYIDHSDDGDHKCFLYKVNELYEPWTSSAYSRSATPTYWDLKACISPIPTTTGIGTIFSSLTSA